MRRLLIISLLAPFLFLFSPAVPAFASNGQCWVTASTPAHHTLYGGLQVVTGTATNHCDYPASVFTLEMAMQKRYCTLWLFCGWSTYWNGPVQYYSPGLHDVSELNFAPWKGSGDYRLLVNGGCFNCYVPYGAVYGYSRHLS